MSEIFEAGSDSAQERSAQIARLTGLMSDLRETSDGLGRSLTTAFTRGIVQGKRFEDVLRGVGLRLSETLLKAAFKPLETGLSGLLQTGVSSLLGGLSASAVQPFAQGGVVGAPTWFPMGPHASGRQIGLMGEAGPEAILPLARGADGRLGVRAGPGAGRAAPITVQITTPDVEGFRRAEAQVTAAIARAVARGTRAT